MSRTVVVVRGIRRRWKVSLVLLVLIALLIAYPQTAPAFVAGLTGGA